MYALQPLTRTYGRTYGLQDTNRSLLHSCTEAEAESGKTVAAKDALRTQKVGLAIEPVFVMFNLLDQLQLNPCSPQVVHSSVKPTVL